MALPQPIPDLLSLDLLTSVAEMGSITEAAIVHRMSQPAVSMRIRSLEQTLGVDLLDRTGGRAKLSDAGVAVVGWAEKVIDATRALQLGVAAILADSHSQLEIAASMTVAEYLVPTWLATSRVDLPEVAVALRMGNSANVANLVRSRQVSLGFIEGKSIPSQVGHEVLMEDSLVVVVSPKHPWAQRRRSITPGVLTDTPLLLREEGSGTREVLESALGEFGLTIRAAAELSSTTAIKTAIAAGVAPAVLSSLAVSDDLATGRLVEVPIKGVDLRRSLRVLWDLDSPMSSAARGFLEIVRTSLARLNGG